MGKTDNINSPDEDINDVYAVDESIQIEYDEMEADLTVGIANTTAPLKIASTLLAAANMTGLIDQVVVWSKAISDNVRNKYWKDGDGVTYPTD